MNSLCGGELRITIHGGADYDRDRLWRPHYRSFGAAAKAVNVYSGTAQVRWTCWKRRVRLKRRALVRADGAFQTQDAAIEMKEHLQRDIMLRRCSSSRGRPDIGAHSRASGRQGNDARGYQSTKVREGGVFLVRLD